MECQVLAVSMEHFEKHKPCAITYYLQAEFLTALVPIDFGPDRDSQSRQHSSLIHYDSSRFKAYKDGSVGLQLL